MRYALILLVLALGGCSSSAPSDAPAAQPGTTQASGTSTSSGGVTPVTPTPIPNAPVTGGENLQGGGGGTQQVAKERAKQAAAASGSLDHGGDDGDGGGEGGGE